MSNNLPTGCRYLMRPILSDEDFQTLRKAGLIWFDHGMSKGNEYGLDISKLVTLVSKLGENEK